MVLDTRIFDWVELTRSMMSDMHPDWDDAQVVDSVEKITELFYNEML